MHSLLPLQYDTVDKQVVEMYTVVHSSHHAS